MPFCSTRRPTVMIVGPAKDEGLARRRGRQGIGQKGELLLGNEGLKRVERALAVRGHHIGPGIDDVAEPLDPGPMPLETRIVPLGDNGVRRKSARGEHGENIGLSEKRENGVGLDLADRAPQPDRSPALPDHREDRTCRPETEGQQPRGQVGLDVSSEKARALLWLAAVTLDRRELLEFVIKGASIVVRIGRSHRRARMKHDARIDPIDDGLMAEDGDVNIETTLDERVCRVHRDPLRSARSEMRDHEQKLLLGADRARTSPAYRRAHHHSPGVLAIEPIHRGAEHGFPRWPR